MKVASMLLVCRVATAIVVAAALAVFILSVYLLWNARPLDYLPINTAFASDLDAHAQLIQDKLDVYSQRINEMEKMVIILLGITGLYTIIFVLTADFGARSAGRQVDRAMTDVKDQIGATRSEVRELKEEMREALRTESKEAAERLDRVQQQAREMIQELRAEEVAAAPNGVVHNLENIHQRIAAIADSRASDEQVQEVMHYEGELPALELLHSRHLSPQLAQIYRDLARYFRQQDAARARFYLGRAAAMAPQDFETTNELGWLALDGPQAPDCRLARKHFEASLAAQPSQQRAKYGLALVARAEGDLETALGLLESAVESENWETRPDPKNAASIHYALACVLARRGLEAPQGYRAQYLVRSTQHLQAAFAYPSHQLEQMLSRDTEDDGDLFVLANTPPYENVINDLLLNLSVGAA